MSLLYQLRRAVLQCSDPNLLVAQALDRSLSLVGGEFGNLQLLDTAGDSLKIVAHNGFKAEFLAYFADVKDDRSACGRAAMRGVQTVIEDVNVDEAFAPHREVAADSGFRAVQSTPIIDFSGQLLGVISTHYRNRHRPTRTELQMIGHYAGMVGEALSRHHSSDRAGLASSAV
ncbi:MAG TPA: GAF domain-containing protein [Candidatus Dormibacteraeota bacterium]